LFNKFGNLVDGTDFNQHTQNSLVGTSVARTIEGTSGTSNTSVDINTRRGEMANSRGRTVEFVFSVEDEQNFKSTGLNNTINRTRTQSQRRERTSLG
jgi:hypothetical protein